MISQMTHRSCMEITCTLESSNTIHEEYTHAHPSIFSFLMLWLFKTLMKVIDQILSPHKPLLYLPKTYGYIHVSITWPYLKAFKWTRSTMDASILSTKSATEISFSVTNSTATTRTTKSLSPFECVETNGLLKFGYFSTLRI